MLLSGHLPLSGFARRSSSNCLVVDCGVAAELQPHDRC
jgi:hypothetical protein